MALVLYNTLSKKKEIFKPIKGNKGKEVKIYTCGPTVYWYAHAGNFRSYVFADVLKRVLQFNKYKVRHIINITDVGHLTSDADEGEDKLEKAAKKEGKTAKEISEFYTHAFKEDYKKLNLIEPTRWVKATSHIKEQIDLIRILEKKGYTYKTKDGIYFDTSKFKDYGKLTNKKVEGLEGGKRIALKEKKHKTDFAIWKFSEEGVKRQQEWKSPWGKGFPGWHLECSAMATKYLGKQFDIHTGGEDLAPIHNENEIAQSQVGYGKSPWVKYWMHGAFLILEGGKMAKSQSNVKTISELEKEGVSAQEYKYFTYTAHYRSPLTWSKEALTSAVNSYKRLKNIIKGLKDDKKTDKKYLSEFEKKINDDLDMPKAIAVMWNMLRDEKASGKLKTIKKMDEVFGLNLLEKDKISIPKEIKNLAVKREKARKEKNFSEGDKLRVEIKKLGWNIKDEKNNYVLEKI